MGNDEFRLKFIHFDMKGDEGKVLSGPGKVIRVKEAEAKRPEAKKAGSRENCGEDAYNVNDLQVGRFV